MVVGAVLGYFLTRRRTKPPRYLAFSELWVFLPDVQMPVQDAVMTRMLVENPFSRRGQSPVGHAEGLVFSDIRLHIALALRSKNSTTFRPDVLLNHAEPGADIAQDLAAAQSFVKLRYVSEEPLKNRVHLQFLNHAAAAYAALGQAKLIYDATAEKLYRRSEFESRLAAKFDVSDAESNCQVIWTREAGSDIAETRGLRKIGLPELQTFPLPEDQRTLITQVLEIAVERLWDQTTLPESLDVEAFDDQFKLVFEPMKGDKMSTRILRMQAP